MQHGYHSIGAMGLAPVWTNLLMLIKQLTNLPAWGELRRPHPISGSSWEFNIQGSNFSLMVRNGSLLSKVESEVLVLWSTSSGRCHSKRILDSLDCTTVQISSIGGQIDVGLKSLCTLQISFLSPSPGDFGLQVRACTTYTSSLGCIIITSAHYLLQSLTKLG